MTKTSNDLTESVRKYSVGVLNQTLADLSDLQSQCKQAHWNVRGPGFMVFHELFDKLAGMAGAEIDTAAERAVALGGEAKGTLQMAARASVLPDLDEGRLSGEDFVNALTVRFAKIANDTRTNVEECMDAGDQDTADILIDISRELDKGLWFLESSQ